MSQDPDAPPFDVTNWMGQLAQNDAYKNIFITQMNIPGTHESLAIYGGSYTKCMAYSIKDQLNMGFRFFDIRLGYKKDDTRNKEWLEGRHGKKVIGTDQKITLTKLSEAVSAWLREHGSECIIFKIKNELDDKHKEFAKVFSNVMSTFDKLYHVYGKEIPKLSDCAGKVVVMIDVKSKATWTKDDIFATKSFIPFEDRREHGGGHKSLGNKKGLDKRWVTFTDSIKELITKVSVTHAKEKIYRTGLNANSASHNSPLRGGTPLYFAQNLNARAAEWLFSQLFTVTPSPYNIKGNGVFIGVVLFDIPDTCNKVKELVPHILASFISNSNCISPVVLSTGQKKDLKAKKHELDMLACLGEFGSSKTAVKKDDITKHFASWRSDQVDACFEHLKQNNIPTAAHIVLYGNEHLMIGDSDEESRDYYDVAMQGMISYLITCFENNSM